MKTSTIIWIVVLVAVVSAIIYFQRKRSANPIGTILTDPITGNKEIIVGTNPTLSGCPRGSFVCSRDPYKCCKEVLDNARTSAESFCTKHGGTWNPITQKCSAFTERVVTSHVNPVHFGGGGANGNPAGH